MKNSQMSIETKGRHAKITVDGRELHGVRGYQISHDAKGVPIIQLSLLATDVTFDSDALPELPEPYNEWYVSIQKLIDSGLITEEQILALK